MRINKYERDGKPWNYKKDEETRLLSIFLRTSRSREWSGNMRQVVGDVRWRPTRERIRKGRRRDHVPQESRRDGGRIQQRRRRPPARAPSSGLLGVDPDEQCRGPRSLRGLERRFAARCGPGPISVGLLRQKRGSIHEKPFPFHRPLFPNAIDSFLHSTLGLSLNQHKVRLKWYCFSRIQFVPPRLSNND